MGPREPTRQEIIDLLGRAAEQAQYAEGYHAAAADPGALAGQAAHQAARDAAAMQLIELAGRAEGFVRDRGDPGTTLARFDDALRGVFNRRMEHTHPESGVVPRPITPHHLGVMVEQVKTSWANLDRDTLKIQARDQIEALREIMRGLTQIERDGLPNAAALRPRDLHYAGYYREIRFARLAKATGLYDNWDKSFRHQDARSVAINRSIFDADNMAHKFHALRRGADKSLLPESVVAAQRLARVEGRPLSAVIRDLRDGLQTPVERLAELEAADSVRRREQRRDSIQGLAATYAQMTGDPTAAALIRDYVQRREPRLDRETIDGMREALQVAASLSGDYAALPQTVRDCCLEMCCALDDEQGDSRLIRILDAAEGRRGAGRVEGPTKVAQGRAGEEAVEVTRGDAPAARAGPTGAAEKDLYLAAILAAHEPELSPAKDGPERDASPEQSPSRGRKR
jgi:hypothetical protein